MSSMLEIPPPQVKARKKRLIPLLCILLILAALPAWLYFSATISKESTLSPNLISINSPVSSPLAEVLTESASLVQKGQTLARINLSGYQQNLAHAMALTRGTFGAAPSSEEAAQRVATAQGAEADTVNRIAMARHEETTQRLRIEQLSVDHARALLHLRGMEATQSKKYLAAQQKELQYRQQLQSAKAAFEVASRSRAAIEGELYKIREERLRTGQGAPVYSLNTADSLNVPDAIIAPQDGYIIGNVPAVGQVVAQNSTLFTLLVASPRFYITTQVPTQQAQNFTSDTFAFIFTPNGQILEGSIINSTPSSAGNNLVSIEADAAHLNLEEVRDILQQDTAKMPDKNVDANTMPLKSTHAQVVFWPNNLFTASLMQIMKPLFSLYALL